MNRPLRFGYAAVALILLACSSACSSSESPAARSSDLPTTPPETGETPAKTEAEEADALATKAALWLSGNFDSIAQAKRDAEFREIGLTACKVEASELGKHALYIEQSVIGSATPYRQRVYIVEPIDATSARSLVFELTAPETAIGSCARATEISFTSADVIAREGCHVELHWVGDHFLGHTPNARWNGSEFEPDPAGAKCSSTLQGATYAESSVELRDGMLRSWDRGFDDEDKQVWGAVKGPYEFVRTSGPDRGENGR